ncbi:MAG: RNA polymerase sigma factor [Candidatus Aminicenantes bacterium]|jgi:RNA polymerase sigma-70 factor (ECF subfamily)
MDEQELIRRVQQGDEMAFSEIVRAYKDRIVNFLCQSTGDYQKATELAQETFLRVYFKANKYKPIAPFSSWIYTIASNLAKTEMKKERRMPTVSFDDVQNTLSKEGDLADNPRNSELRKNLRKALQNLHPRYRIPVILKDIEGFSQDEIAEILKKPVGTIKARISRGRNYLKKELEKTSFSMNFLTKNEECENGSV